MKKNSVSVSSHSLGTFLSPGAPDFGGQKGWSSERVPHPACSRRRNSATTLTPFYSGRTLPSKWEDAERWICSPVSGYGVGKKSALQQTQRRPKSKSGPLGPPGTAGYYSNYSPSLPVVDGSWGLRNLGAGSPLSTGVLGPDGLSVYYCGGGGEMEKNVTRSINGPGWSDLLSESYSIPSSQDESTDDKVDSNKDDEETLGSRAVSRRDMATQMSPEAEGSAHKGETSPSRIVEEEWGSEQVRDVQVDKRATVISWSRRHSKEQSPHVEEAARDVSKSHRDEARITAWENLHRAKAEAAIRKLEMKLEKKRSSSMDKILKELKAAEVKAQKMRSATKQDQPDKKIRHKVTRTKGLTGCFTCHAF